MSLTPTEVVRLVSRLVSRDRRLAAAFRHELVSGETASGERSLLDAVDQLDRLSAPHALIGSLAVAVHTGLASASLGVDLAVRSDIDRDQLVAAFLRAGFTLRGRFEHSINFAHASGDPVQLALDPGFDQAVARAETIRIAETDVRIARRDDLIALKERAAADPRRRRSKALRDCSDIELLRGDVPSSDEGW